MDAIERRKADIEQRELRAKEREAKYRRDIAKTIKGATSKVQTRHKTPAQAAKQDSDVESESGETGISSDYTIESCDLQIPDTLGGPAPPVQAIELHDDKAFP